MIMGVLLGFAAIAVVSSLVGDGETETDDPVTEDGGLRVVGGAEGDLLDGSNNDDRFFGKDGDDLIIGQSGDDALFGDAGNDGVFGGDGDDFLRGGAGDDLIIGDAGADEIYGDAGDDTIISAAILDENSYQTSLATAQSPDGVTIGFDFRPDIDEGDIVHAGAGDDMLLFGSDDQVTGGDGSDIFLAGEWIVPGKPATITDFDADEDVIGYQFEGAEPEITTALDQDGTATVMADGVAFLVVQNAGPDFDDTLIELLQV